MTAAAVQEAAVGTLAKKNMVIMSLLETNWIAASSGRLDDSARAVWRRYVYLQR